MAVPSAAQEVRPDPTSSAPFPTLLRPRVEALLRDGDTLAALDLLQDPAERPEPSDWADSLLNALVLPEGDAPAPSRPRAAWVARLDGGFLGHRTSSGTTSATLLTDRVVRLRGERLAQSIRGGIRWHALRGEYLSATGIEPQASWSAQAGNLAGSLRGWALWTQDLGNDAGLDAALRTQVRPWWWTGAEVSYSMEANRCALLGVGTEFRSGAWSLSGSLRTGWKRLIPLDPEPSKVVGIDSIVNGILWLDDGILSPEEISSLPGRPLESISPDRWLLTTRGQALANFGDFQAGFEIVFEGLHSIRSEQWLPDSRTTIVSGTPILLAGNQHDKPLAVVPRFDAGYDLVPVRAIRRGRVLSILSTPALHGSWRPRGRAWSLEGLLAWNLPYASQPGHPLADDRQGPEARVGSEIRW